MEKVKNLVKSLKLSATEQKGFRREMLAGDIVGKDEVQALGKVLSDRPAHAESLALSLGRAWCPIKGVRCKEMGANIFLFTYFQDLGKS